MLENSFDNLIQKQLSRRSVLQFGLGAMLASAMPLSSAATILQLHPQLMGFKAIPVADLLDEVVVPEGYRAEVFYRWGDPVSDGPVFNMDASNSAAEQALQAGMHHDAIHFYSLPADSANSDHGLLVMNHEYLDLDIIHTDGSHTHAPETYTADKVAKEQNAHGVSLIEVKRDNGQWQIVRPSKYARRLTANSEMQISGPAAGHDLLKTHADPDGKNVLGTLNNCANGKTPWGTYLTCEENFHYYFVFDPKHPRDAETERRWKRYKLGFSYYGWQQFDSRFDLDKEPNEANRFGWVVEFDPYDPQSIPVKRTALGRFAHENVAIKVAADNRIACYSGDDARFEYIYKFVTRDSWDGTPGAHHGKLLDEGVLFVARFDDEGIGVWLPLIYGQNGLIPENGFSDQGDVLIHARAAADQLGATKMDRPEWITVHPETGEIFVSLTNNSERSETNPANPRQPNLYGHLLRFNEVDATSTEFTWEVFVLAGGEEHGATINGDIFANPDGLMIDQRGLLWVQTDISSSKMNEGEFAQFGNNQMLAVNPATGETRRFLTGPVGCEVTGVTITPDMKTMWVNIQHPGEMPAVLEKRGIVKSPQNPSAASNWPDHLPNGRPRSATVLITKEDGGVIGT
ncbi:MULTISPECIES: PhoX family protein [unclassified Methylophaga]|uniref:PhoX family protein n=1 Tax=unclassified Methylophaga TaxID=2629249 RepID=UPI000C986518|nr:MULTISPECIES: PhoX family phosphatase [unclassified Methylophaga]MBN46847.1 Tat pathway signal protein [Methylophaga sp.]|tara:strand:- start:155899 stop:157785 length:1887 start_codon:yes stop_codon:yes gene_type:complete